MTDHDVRSAADRLGVTERTMRRWLRDGRLASYKVGGRIRIPDRAVREAAAPYGTALERDATLVTADVRMLEAARKVGCSARGLTEVDMAGEDG